MDDRKIRISTYAFDTTGDDKLDRKFKDAERRYSLGIDEEGRPVLFWLWVRLSGYDCTAELKAPILSCKVGEVQPETGGRRISIELGPMERVITDDGQTPSSVIGNLAKYIGQYGRQLQRGGRPPGMAESTEQKYITLAADFEEAVKEYDSGEERPLTQAEFCEEEDTPSRATLTRARRYQKSRRSKEF